MKAPRHFDRAIAYRQLHLQAPPDTNPFGSPSGVILPIMPNYVCSHCQAPVVPAPRDRYQGEVWQWLKKAGILSWARFWSASISVLWPILEKHAPQDPLQRASSY